MAAPTLFFEDLQVGQVDRFGAYRVTRDEVIEIASRFDPQPFHIDEEAAAANPIFGGLSASAIHTLAMTSRMQADRATVTGFRPHAGLGMQDMQTLHPVYPGDTLSVAVEITELRVSRSRPDCGIVTSAITTLNQQGTAVMRFRAVFLFKRRPQDP